MSTVLETVRTVQHALEVYVRPREEAAHIRRVLATNLESCLDNTSAGTPLALAVPSESVTISQELRGMQKEYLKALDANAKARRNFNNVQREHLRTAAPTIPRGQIASSYLLEDHLITVKLQKKQDRLRAVEKYLKLLSEKPAATDGFLDPEEIFKDAAPLPEVPKIVVDGFTVDKEAAKTSLMDLISQLEKSCLRAKLLLRKEERLLENVRARSNSLPDKLSNEARLQGLSASRNELIIWIENELGKASGEGTDPLGESSSGRSSSMPDKTNTDDRLKNIKEKYARYLAARKALIQTVTQSPQPVIKPSTNTEDSIRTPKPLQPSTTYLLSPYLENLLAVAHEQKGLIAQKAHLNVTLAKQLKDACQATDHLAEESQLLPSYPLPGSFRGNRGIGQSLAAPESLDVSTRMKDWVFAADSAKIATLEAVAEQVEEGQLALEASMKILGEINQLLGRSTPNELDNEAGATEEEDIWLLQEPSSKNPNSARRISKKRTDEAKDTDIWSMLDGSVGLIRSNDDRT